MTLFLLHENTERQDDKNLICLPDRFNWLAFLLPPIWALGNRLWFTFFVMVLSVLGLSFLGEFIVLPMIGLYVLAVLWLGFEANALVGSSFARRGWQALNPVMAADRTRAEQRHFGRKKCQAARIEREKLRVQQGSVE